MAASYAASMDSIGLPPLAPSACADAFQRAGYGGQSVLANIDIKRFCQVNQVRSKWSYVTNLASRAQVGSTAISPRLKLERVFMKL